MSLPVSIARRGYYWYLGLKVLKLLSFPLYVVAFMLLFPLYGLLQMAIALKDAAIEMAQTDWKNEMDNLKRFFYGFSRGYYDKLYNQSYSVTDHYRTLASQESPPEGWNKE